jgi:hypothetical protein
LGDDILCHVDFGNKQNFVYVPPPMPENKKLIIVLKRTAKFFISLLEKIERGEDV